MFHFLVVLVVSILVAILVALLVAILVDILVMLDDLGNLGWFISSWFSRWFSQSITKHHNTYRYFHVLEYLQKLTPFDCDMQIQARLCKLLYLSIGIPKFQQLYKYFQKTFENRSNTIFFKVLRVFLFVV